MGKFQAVYRYPISENKSIWYRWHHIKRRCRDPRSPRYKDYGGRGIDMCDEWYDSFDTFADWAYSNGFSPELTIERIDVNKGYCPENCCWIKREEQAFNKRQTIWVDYKGRHVQLMKLCIEKNLTYDAIHNRIMAMGWDVERAIDEPLYTPDDSLMSKCKERGLNYGVVRDRINKLGWSEIDALSVPTGRGRNVNHYAERQIESKCDRCGKTFVKIVGRQHYCSDKCRKAAKKERLMKKR